MYKYEDFRSAIFTDKGQREFLKVRDEAQRLLELSGSFMMFSALKGICGTSWQQMAYIDRLVELGEIREITGKNTAAQHRIFVDGSLGR